MLQTLCPQSYSVALYLVRQLTSSDLLQRLKTIGVKHPELCKALGEQLGPRAWLCPVGPALFQGVQHPWCVQGWLRDNLRLGFWIWV